MECNIQEHPNSPGHSSTSDSHSENFNDDTWASFPEISDKEQLQRVQKLLWKLVLTFELKGSITIFSITVKSQKCMKSCVLNEMM